MLLNITSFDTKKSVMTKLKRAKTRLLALNDNSEQFEKIIEVLDKVINELYFMSDDCLKYTLKWLDINVSLFINKDNNDIAVTLQYLWLLR